MTDESCENCRFWRWDRETARDESECRRHAPQPEVPKDGIPLPMAWWPVTDKEDWCGEWRRKKWQRKKASPAQEKLVDGNTLIMNCKLSVRTRKGIWRALNKKRYGDKSAHEFDDGACLGDLCQLSVDNLLTTKGFGVSSLTEVMQFLDRHGMSLAKRPGDTTPD